MAHTKSALKTIKTSKKKHEINKAIKSSLFTIEKKIRAGVEAKEDNVQDLFTNFCSVLDKAAKRNVVHKNKIARKKSQLSSLISAK